MAKKITINKGTEEIELTEREEKIYESAYNTGWQQGSILILGFLIFMAFVIMGTYYFTHR